MDSGFAILNTTCCEDGNFMLLHVELNNNKFVLCSIYGPNRDNDLIFFDRLKTALRQFNCPRIIGGDWNATFDTSNIETNLDVVNMRSIPSLRRSQKVHELCVDLDLVEPFRIVHPNKKEYTFIPSGLNDNNRSRLDYFLISTVLLNPSTQVTIPNSLNTTLFDHKSVTLTLSRRKLPNKNIIKDTILNNVDLEHHVQAAVYECYLLHYSPPINVGGGGGWGVNRWGSIWQVLVAS